ncbi:spermatogenesis-associated protein 16 [Tachysurus ichikawai]
MLPKTTAWSKSTSFILTLVFKRNHDGILAQSASQELSHVHGSISYCYATDTEDLHGMCETLGKKILPVLDFIKYSKLALRREQEQAQVLEHTLAELALAPYLQEVGPSDTRLLQALMADTMDTLEGKRTDQERVWNAMQKVEVTEDLIYQWENSYLKSQVHQPVRKQ